MSPSSPPLPSGKFCVFTYVLCYGNASATKPVTQSSFISNHCFAILDLSQLEAQFGGLGDQAALKASGRVVSLVGGPGPPGLKGALPHGFTVGTVADSARSALWGTCLSTRSAPGLGDSSPAPGETDPGGAAPVGTAALWGFPQGRPAPPRGPGGRGSILGPSREGVRLAGLGGLAPGPGRGSCTAETLRVSNPRFTRFQKSVRR